MNSGFYLDIFWNKLDQLDFRVKNESSTMKCANVDINFGLQNKINLVYKTHSMARYPH